MHVHVLMGLCSYVLTCACLYVQLMTMCALVWCVHVHVHTCACLCVCVLPLPPHESVHFQGQTQGKHHEASPELQHCLITHISRLMSTS